MSGSLTCLAVENLLQLNVTPTARALVRLLIVHAVPETASQPAHPPNEEPGFGAAVSVIVVPEAKAALQLFAQLRPGGALVTVPEPVPAKSTARVTPVKQTTLAVM